MRAKATFTMSSLLMVSIAIAGANFSLGAQTRPAVELGKTTEKMALKVLYVGVPDTERTKDFIAFLAENFNEVETTDVNAFKEAQTAGFDVVLLDKDGIEWGISRIEHPLAAIKFSEQYNRATISLGIPGAFFVDKMGLKPGYR